MKHALVEEPETACLCPCLQEPEEAADAGNSYIICTGCWNSLQHGDQPEGGQCTDKTPPEGDKRSDKAQRVMKLMTKDKTPKWSEYASPTLYHHQHCMPFVQKLASDYGGRVEIPDMSCLAKVGLR
jgi:hypothetical protein